MCRKSFFLKRIHEKWKKNNNFAAGKEPYIINPIARRHMDYLPEDPAILVSSVNMLLRDEEYDSLESLCYAFGRDPGQVKDYLLGNGFVWSERQKQFRPIGYDA